MPAAARYKTTHLFAGRTRKDAPYKICLIYSPGRGYMVRDPDLDRILSGEPYYRNDIRPAGLQGKGYPQGKLYMDLPGPGGYSRGICHDSSSGDEVKKNRIIYFKTQN